MGMDRRARKKHAAIDCIRLHITMLYMHLLSLSSLYIPYHFATTWSFLLVRHTFLLHSVINNDITRSVFFPLWSRRRGSVQEWGEGKTHLYPSSNLRQHPHLSPLLCTPPLHIVTLRWLVMVGDSIYKAAVRCQTIRSHTPSLTSARTHYFSHIYYCFQLYSPRTVSRPKMIC